MNILNKGALPLPSPPTVISEYLTRHGRNTKRSLGQGGIWASLGLSVPSIAHPSIVQTDRKTKRLYCRFFSRASHKYKNAFVSSVYRASPATLLMFSFGLLNNHGNKDSFDIQSLLSFLFFLFRHFLVDFFSYVVGVLYQH
jgi:hypothetical protein